MKQLVSKEVGKFIVYLKGGHSFKVKAKSVNLKWDAEGNVTAYDFQWSKPQYREFVFPPQSIIGVRKLR